MMNKAKVTIGRIGRIGRYCRVQQGVIQSRKVSMVNLPASASSMIGPTRCNSSTNKSTASSPSESLAINGDSSKPGSFAFADIEQDAVVDLFYHHAKTSDADANLSAYLDLDGMRALLHSIGEKCPEATVERLFKAADLNQDGMIELNEFLLCADEILGGSPARMVLVVGGPGSGKGILCNRLEQECNVVHLSSGELLRDEVRRGTPLGKEVEQIMERGELVSSAVIVTLIRRRMRDHPGKRVLLDGFPRSLENAHDLVDICGKPELALHLNCDDTILLERVIKRGKEGDRADDNIQTALTRLRTFHKYHHTQMEWLREQGVPIVNLDCSGSSENVWNQLLAIGRLMRPSVKLTNGDHKNVGSDSEGAAADDDQPMIL